MIIVCTTITVVIVVLVISYCCLIISRLKVYHAFFDLGLRGHSRDGFWELIPCRRTKVFGPSDLWIPSHAND